MLPFMHRMRLIGNRLLLPEYIYSSVDFFPCRLSWWCLVTFGLFNVSL